MSETDKKTEIFDTSKASDAAKEFRGVIQRAEYGKDTLGFEGSTEFASRNQLGIEILSPEYQKPQYEWYAPPDGTRMRKNTKEVELVLERHLGLLEGLLDGEGTIGLYLARCQTIFPYRFVPVVKVSNKSIPLLEKLQQFFGGRIEKHGVAQYQDEKYYDWEMTREMMRAILPEIHLVIKERKKELILEVLDLLGWKGRRMTEDRFSRLVEIKEEFDRC